MTQINLSRESEIEIMKRLVFSVTQHSTGLPDEKLGFFSAHVGALYSHRLMVVGRATNGWNSGFSPLELSNSQEKHTECVKRIADEICNHNLQWYADTWGKGKQSGGNEEYDPQRSAFWRVIRETSQQLNIVNQAPDKWPSFLVWSNLYKVAPVKGGNPSEKLCRIQRQDCIALLKHEISLFKPKAIVFLTGYNWAKPFIEHISTNFSELQKTYMEISGYINKLDDIRSCFVVAKHPQGKKESTWVKELVEVLNAISQ